MMAPVCAHMNPIQKAYSTFATKRFPLPTTEQVDQLEERIRAVLPSDYRQFLLNYNGGYFSEPEIRAMDDSAPLSLLTCLFGINATDPYAELAQPSYLALFEENDPPVILPIGDTPMNSLIILELDGDSPGSILLKMAFGDFYYLASGIEEFFTLLHDRADQLP
jgi:hypothetical protein